jgi:hypothetical protein
MAPDSHFNNHSLPVDRSLAAQIVEASRAEHAHVARSSQADKSKKDSDAASVSSFGSTIGLLKNKFHSPSAPKKDSPAPSSAMQKDILRNQVNIFG